VPSYDRGSPGPGESYFTKQEGTPDSLAGIQGKGPIEEENGSTEKDGESIG